MSEEKKSHRQLSEIQVDYQSSATRAGHIQYQIYALKRDLDLVNQRLADLNFEAAASQRAETTAAEPQVEVKEG